VKTVKSVGNVQIKLINANISCNEGKCPSSPLEAKVLVKLKAMQAVSDNQTVNVVLCCGSFGF
jgi:hypothetical protein